MSSTTINYRINNKPLNIKNIINYLYSLKYYKIIPNFGLNFTATEMEILTVYSSNDAFPYRGHTIITYNITTKKWKSCIYLYSVINNKLINNIFTILHRNYPYLCINNILKIDNTNYPYADYILESDYIEDIFEPSFISFNQTHSINPRNITINRYIVDSMRRAFQNNNYEAEIEAFYQRIEQEDKRVLLESIKEIINNKHYLPEEIWRNVARFYITNPGRYSIIPHI
jgi:hypothetical protein